MIRVGPESLTFCSYSTKRKKTKKRAKEKTWKPDFFRTLAEPEHELFLQRLIFVKNLIRDSLYKMWIAQGGTPWTWKGFYSPGDLASSDKLPGLLWKSWRRKAKKIGRLPNQLITLSRFIKRIDILRPETGANEEQCKTRENGIRKALWKQARPTNWTWAIGNNNSIIFHEKAEAFILNKRHYAA